MRSLFSFDRAAALALTCTVILGSALASTLLASASAVGARGASDPGGLTLRIGAYLNVTDKSSIEAVISSGTAADSGMDRPTGAEICFVYTVTNNSTGEITLDALRESDTRIGR